MAQAPEANSVIRPTAMGDGAHSAAQQGSVNAIAPAPKPAPPKRTAHYLWAVLIVRIYEVFPLLCPICGGQIEQVMQAHKR